MGGLRTKIHEMVARLGSNDSDLICVTETWLNKDVNDSELNPDNYQIFRRDRDYLSESTTRGGVCIILVRSDLTSPYRIINPTSRGPMAEDITDSLYICTVYSTPTRDHLKYTDFFQPIICLTDLIGYQDKVLFLGDFNSSSIQWIRSSSGVESVIVTSDDRPNALFDTLTYTGRY